MDLTYRELEQLLMDIFDVGEERRPALKGRLKAFRKVGIPEETSVGLGNRVRYREKETFQILITWSLSSKIGIDPSIAAQLVKDLWPQFEDWLRTSMKNLRKDDSKSRFFAFQPDLWPRKDAPQGVYSAAGCYTETGLERLAKKSGGELSEIVAVNLTGLLIGVTYALKSTGQRIDW